MTATNALARLAKWRDAIGVAAALGAVVVVLWAALGFGPLATPERQFRELRQGQTVLADGQVALARADTTANRRIDSLAAAVRLGMGQNTDLLKSLATLRCLDDTPQRDIDLARLPCDSLLANARARRR